MTHGNRLQNHYLREIMRGLIRIKASLAQMRSDPGCHEHVALIRETAARLHDLAMIHGYDGLESISAKIHSTFDKIFLSEEPADIRLISRLEAGISIIQRIAELEDTIERQITIEHISGDVGRRLQKVRDCAFEVSRGWDCSSARQLKLDFEDGLASSAERLKELEAAAGSDTEERLPFDISEFETVLRIVDFDSENEVNHTLELF